MIRLFNAYFPTRTLLLTVTEALLVTLGFVLAVVFWAGTAFDANIYLLYENGLGRIGLVVGVFLMLMYYFDLYDSVRALQPARGGHPAGRSTGLLLRRLWPFSTTHFPKSAWAAARCGSASASSGSPFPPGASFFSS